MSKSRNTDDRPVKAKRVKIFTRMQAERAIASGEVPPQRFLDMSDPYQRASKGHGGVEVVTSNHANYHVRAKAWKKMGCPIPDSWTVEDKQKFFTSIHYVERAIGEDSENLNTPGMGELDPSWHATQGDDEPIDHPT